MSAEEFLQSASWVHRIGEVFVLLDTNKNGYLSLEDYELSTSKLAKVAEPDHKLLTVLRTRMEEFCTALGLTRGKRLTKEEYVKATAKLAEEEVARKKRGEELLLFKYKHAVYDVVDMNHDGCVTLDEYKKVFGALVGGEHAEASFKMLDKNNNGKIERSELNQHDYNFWYTIDDKDTKGMYGDKFEK